MNFPSNLLYTQDHEWVLINGDEATVGVTDFAANELGDIVYVEIETMGKDLKAHEAFGTVEAVKTVSDLFMPLAGKVTAINEALKNTPEIVNSDPYGEGWMVKIKLENPSDTSGLLKQPEYLAHIGQ